MYPWSLSQSGTITALMTSWTLIPRCLEISLSKLLAGSRVSAKGLMILPANRRSS
jgi:hypothetical protein